MLRPDRLTAAMSKFVATSIGTNFITSQSFDLERSFEVSIIPYISQTLRQHPTACGAKGSLKVGHSHLPCLHVVHKTLVA